MWSTPKGAFLASAVTEIDIGGCGLMELPRSIGSMVSLRKLNAAKNMLSSLPSEVANLKQLRVAFFLGCQFEVVPEVLGTLPRLFMLSFKANKLRSIPDRALSPSIGWLILSDNRLTELPPTIGSLRGLRKLMLAGNQLRDLPPSLHECVNLELLRLADNRLQAVPSALLHLPKLAWLALAANDFNRGVAAEVVAVGSRRKGVTVAAMTKGQEGQEEEEGEAGRSLATVEVLGAEVVQVDSGCVLGNGASGVVFKGRFQIAPRHSAAAQGTAAAASSSSSSSRPSEAPRSQPLLLNETSASSSSSQPSPCSSAGVAVKIFRAGKTSDGDPADEMAASAVAGRAGCPHLLRAFGVLEPALARKVAQEAPASAGGRGGSLGVCDLGLVMELLDGYVSLGGPPSFASVTRDVYPGDGLRVHPLTGECADPASSLGPTGASGGSETANSPPPRSMIMPSLSFVLAVLESVAWAATTLHAHGISHGDLYAHNILLRPTTAAATAAATAAETSPSPQTTPSKNKSDEWSFDGYAVLSDLGAATFYKGTSTRKTTTTSTTDPAAAANSSPQTKNNQKEEEKEGQAGVEAQLVERLEVLAFGHLATELLDRCGGGAHPRVPSSALPLAALRSLAAECRGPVVAARPSFAAILDRVREVTRTHHAEEG